MKLGWVIGSYFPVAGAFLLAFYAGALLKVTGEIPVLGLLAAAACVGGYLAARASRGTTILEPALGAALFIFSLIFLVLTKSMDGMSAATNISFSNSAGTTFLLKIVGAFAVGGFGGACLGEMRPGSRSGRPGQFVMTLYAFFTVLGGLFIGFVLLAILARPTSMDEAILLVLIFLASASFMGGFVSRLAGSNGGATVIGAFLAGGALLAPFIGDGGSGRLNGAAIISLGVILCAFIGSLVGGVFAGKDSGTRESTA